MKFKEYITEKNEGVQIKEDKFGKKTKYIELSTEEFNIVSKDFENTNRNIYIKAQNHIVLKV